MYKNTDGTLKVFAFNRTNNAPVTGDAANITCRFSLDGGARSPIADTNPTELEDGYYLFDVTSGETNGITADFFPESTTLDVQVIPVEHSRHLLDGNQIYVYPLSMDQEPRNTHAPIVIYTGETGSQFFFAYDSNGVAIDLTGRNLEFRIGNTTTKKVLYVAKTADATLSISLTNKVTFTRSTVFTRYESSEYKYSLRDITAGAEVLLEGPIELKWAP